MIESHSPLYDAFKGILNTIDKERVQELLAYMNTEAINFNLFKNNAFIERKFPFDIIPRIVSANEFSYLEKGIQQRIHALNLFLEDIYGAQKILKDGIIPSEFVFSSKAYLPAFSNTAFLKEANSKFSVSETTRASALSSRTPRRKKR